MQESFSEITLAELPLVIFNMARGQQDYFQATRGGGHGDYRHIVLAPQDVSEAVELTQLAFHLADKWRNPVLVYGDYLSAHTQEAVTIEPIDFGPLPTKDWARRRLARRAPAASRIVSPLGFGKPGQPEPRHRAAPAARSRDEACTQIEASEVRVETGFLDDAETVIVAFGSPGEVRALRRRAAARRRASGSGYVRPITLWPFPYEAVRAAARRRATRRRRSSSAPAR